MSDELKSKILSATPIANLIGEHVALSDRGYMKVGLCPFHEERGPSFTVYPDHYHCFGCKESGDAISFVRKFLGLGFVDALKMLGQRAGIDTSELDLQHLAKSARNDTSQLFKIMLVAQHFFIERLSAPIGKNVREYLDARGFAHASVKEYGFGFAPDEMRSLTDHLLKQGFKPADLEACSVATPSAKNGQLYDFFRNRLTIPIHDIHGRLIAFGGRAMDDFPPKYKNSRDTKLFDKSQTLFGLHRARESIRKGGQALIVEGYMDAIQLWNYGFHGTAACMGTALRSSHLRMLSHLTQKAVLIFDGDLAGQRANLNTLNASLDIPRLDIRVVCLPAEDDPDSFVVRNGAGALQDLIDHAEGLLEFCLRTRLQNASPVAVADILHKELLPWLGQVKDTLRRAVLLNRVSFYSGVTRDTLEREIQSGHSGSPRPSVQKKALETVTRTIAKPLDSLAFDLVGHVFFAQPSEVESEILRTYFNTELEMDELWLEFMLDCLKSLETGKCPAEAERSAWSSTTDSQVMGLVEQLYQRRAAFAVEDRRRAISRVKNANLMKKYQSQVARLRGQLNASEQSTTSEILAAIKELNTRISQLQKTGA
jgi:DNA primase